MTFALDLVKHATGHRPKISEEIEEHEMKKVPWKLGPPDSSIRSPQEGTAVLLCTVVEKWVIGYCKVGQKKK